MAEQEPRRIAPAVLHLAHHQARRRRRNDGMRGQVRLDAAEQVVFDVKAFRHAFLHEVGALDRRFGAVGEGQVRRGFVVGIGMAQGLQRRPGARQVSAHGGVGAVGGVVDGDAVTIGGEQARPAGADDAAAEWRRGWFRSSEQSRLQRRGGGQPPVDGEALAGHEPASSEASQTAMRAMSAGRRSGARRGGPARRAFAAAGRRQRRRRRRPCRSGSSRDKWRCSAPLRPVIDGDGSRQAVHEGLGRVVERHAGSATSPEIEPILTMAPPPAASMKGNERAAGVEDAAALAPITASQSASVLRRRSSRPARRRC
jgi:hypothetical protein